MLPSFGKPVLNTPSTTTERFTRLGWIAVVGALACLLWPLLSAERTLAYRDAGHFYYRLFESQSDLVQKHGLRVNELWWNAKENLGQSAHSDATASLYYPAKIWLWSGWPDSFPLRWNLYLLGHVAWALFGAVWLARSLRLQGVAVAWVALAYVAGGVLLIQLCNVIYLVGASWLPWVLGCGIRVIENGRWPPILGGGAGLGMMVLGGDPQTAYHAMLILAVRVFYSPKSLEPNIGEHDPGEDGPDRTRPSWRPEDVVWRCLNVFIQKRRAWMGVGMMAGIGIWLSWIQISGSLGNISQSERNLWDLPRSLWEIPTYSRRDQDLAPKQLVQASMEGLLGVPQEGTHHDFAFQFSLPPWQVAEWLWPNISGKAFPQNQRWTQQLPAADRVWLPSIYAGCLTTALALMLLLRRGEKDRNVRWLKATLGLTLVASLGWYGIGWVAREIWAALGGDLNDLTFGSQVGGLYWFMTLCVPGYIQFRYPAKLMVVASLMLACLAGASWQRLQANHLLRPHRWVVGFAMVTGVALVGSWIGKVAWERWLVQAPPDAVFGPLQIEAAWGDIQSSLVQSLVVFAVAAWIFGWGLRKRPDLTPLWGVVLLVVTAIDLVVAHRSLLPTVPISAWQAPSVIAETLQRSEFGRQSLVEDSLAGGQRTDRETLVPIYRGSMEGWVPSPWWQKSSPERLTQVIDWDRASLFPKHHEVEPITMVEVPGASVAAHHWILMQRARQLGPRRPDGHHEPNLEWLSALGSRYLLLPSWSAVPWSDDADQLEVLPSEEGWPEEVLVLKNKAPLPACWTISRSRYAPFTFDQNLVQAWEQSAAVLMDPETRRPRDFSQWIIVHDPDLISEGSSRQEPNFHPGVVWEDSSDRRTLGAHLESDGWLVIAMSFDAGWTARVKNLNSGAIAPEELHRVNGVMTGLQLPAGDYEVTLSYRPVLWGVHCWIGLLGWGLVSLVLAGMLVGQNPGSRGG
jgi:hypothetical protein